MHGVCLISYWGFFARDRHLVRCERLSQYPGTVMPDRRKERWMEKKGGKPLLDPPPPSEPRERSNLDCYTRWVDGLQVLERAKGVKENPPRMNNSTYFFQTKENTRA